MPKKRKLNSKNPKWKKNNEQTNVEKYSKKKLNLLNFILFLRITNKTYETNTLQNIILCNI